MGTPQESDDAALLVRAVEDLGALEQIYRRYVRRVAAFAARRCSSGEDVADVVAETFDRLFRTAHRYDPSRGTVASYIFTIASSQVGELYRRSARQQALVTRLSGRSLLDDDDMTRLDSAIDAGRSIEVLGPAINQLPDGQGEVLRLVASGLTPSEAADQLGITPNAARVRLAKARRRLRDELAAASIESEASKP